MGHPQVGSLNPPPFLILNFSKLRCLIASCWFPSFLRGTNAAYSDVKRWDHEIISAATRLSASWTIFRVGVLYTRSDPSQAVVAKSGYIGDGLVGVTLYRDDAALWIVRELDERKWEGELMVVSS